MIYLDTNTFKGEIIMENKPYEIDPIDESEYANEDGNDIVTLINANGEEINFIEIAGIAHKGEFYAILQPMELLPGMGEDEALVFHVSRDEKGEDKFDVVLDDEIIDAVFDEYNRLLDNIENDDEEDFDDEDDELDDLDDTDEE